jgi:hypothetical protein
VQLFAGTQEMPGETKTWVRDYAPSDIQRYGHELGSFLTSHQAPLLDLIEEKKDLTAEIRGGIEGALKAFREVFRSSQAAAA